MTEEKKQSLMHKIERGEYSRKGVKGGEGRTPESLIVDAALCMFCIFALLFIFCVLAVIA